LETLPEPNFKELAIRLDSYGRRVFAEYRLYGRNTTISGVGLSVEDFVSKVLWDYLDGKLDYNPKRGTLFSFLAMTVRHDIIDAFRRAPHLREEARSPLPRESKTENQPPSLDELPGHRRDIDDLLSERGYREWIMAEFAGEPELAAVVEAIIDSDRATPKEIAEEVGITVAEYQNIRKRLRRRLIQYHAVKVGEA
jgi:DNA-directed RNA polymerase specialized sigma24 family protein